MTDTAKPSHRQPSVFASRGWRFAVMIVLTLLMFVPLILISLVIEDRVSYRRDALREVSQQWGGEIGIDGPVLIIPVERIGVRTVKDEEGRPRSENFTERAASVVLRPELLDIVADARSEIRHRGIFKVPVYASDMVMSFGFDPARVEQVPGPRETVLWDKAMLVVYLPAARSFSGETVLSAAGRSFDLEPGTPDGNRSGFHARTGDPRRLGEFTLKMGLNGAGRFGFAPAGRLTRVTLTSDWPHPSFTGNFLPKNREITAEGFTATWEVPHLARDIAQVSRGEGWTRSSFGVRFYSPVDIYQRVQRAVKYGVLFIALSFLTVFLMERFSKRNVHPAHFVLIGIAQCTFFLLLLSFAEQIGFTPSYLLAGGATISLISFYAAGGLGLGRRAWALAAALALMYAVLYLILRSADYALLAGSVLAFAAVALAMVMTRGEDWSGRGEMAPAPEPA